MNYKIAICDDDTAALSYFRDLAEEWTASKHIPSVIHTFPSAEAFLFRYAEEPDYDILLLDIEMPGMDGVTMAKTVREKSKTIQIIFVTGYSDYILEGYEVAALHYLMKPVQKEKLYSVLDRAAENLKQNERMLLELSDGIVRLPFYEIRYLEVRQNYVTIHAGKDYTVKRPLGKFEKELDSRFFRSGRSYLINLTYVQRTTRTEAYLTDGSVVPLPRGVYEKINRAIIDRTATYRTERSIP